MIDLECKLITVTIKQDDIGNEVEERSEVSVPIIKHEGIFATEFYSAGTLGLKPNLKLRISELNYSGQKKLKYMNEEYDIIRVDQPTIDEISLICERKIANAS